MKNTVISNKFGGEEIEEGGRGRKEGEGRTEGEWRRGKEGKGVSSLCLHLTSFLSPTHNILGSKHCALSTSTPYYSTIKSEPLSLTNI